MPAKPNDGIDIYDYYLTNDLIERNIIANRHDLTDFIANNRGPEAALC